MCHDILVISREREKFKTAQMTSRHGLNELNELTRSLSEKLMLQQKYNLKT